MLEVLIYLFEVYLFQSDVLKEGEEDDGRNIYSISEMKLFADLIEAGFEGHEIVKALSWLERLSSPYEIDEATLEDSSLIRVFAQEEQEILSIEQQGFLIEMTSLGIITPVMRERILDLVLLVDKTLDMRGLRWITRMVLSNATDRRYAIELFEEWLEAEEEGYLIH